MHGKHCALDETQGLSAEQVHPKPKKGRVGRTSPMYPIYISSKRQNNSKEKRQHNYIVHKIAKLSGFYHSNYQELKQYIVSRNIKNVGFESFSNLQELKDVFSR